MPMDLCSVWIALDEATEQNGCMRMQPGGHKRGPIKHIGQATNTHPRSDGLATSRLSHANPSAPPPGSGDFLYIPHDVCHPDNDMV